MARSNTPVEYRTFWDFFAALAARSGPMGELAKRIVEDPARGDRRLTQQTCYEFILAQYSGPYVDEDCDLWQQATLLYQQSKAPSCPHCGAPL